MQFLQLAFITVADNIEAYVFPRQGIEKMPDSFDSNMHSRLVDNSPREKKPEFSIVAHHRCAFFIEYEFP